MLKRMMRSARPFSGSSAAIAVGVALLSLAACGNSGAGGGEGGSTGLPSAGSSGTGGVGGKSSGVAGSIAEAGTAGVVGASGSAGLGGDPGASGSSALAGGGSGGSGGSTAGSSGSGGSGLGGGPPSTGGSLGGGGAGGGSSGAGGAPVACPPATALTGGKQYCTNTKENVGSRYAFELWAEGAGSGCMTIYGTDGKFSANWTNVEDFLARIGLNFDQTKTHSQIGTISADFAETKTGNTGLVYVGIYGWTLDPLREYYILDDWGDTKPAGFSSDGTPRDSVGTITVDGSVYDVWKKTRVDKPAITGDHKTFDQYFSIRRTARQCGHISISEHFTKWAGLGLSLGKLYEAKILLEAQESTGTIAFTTATVSVK
jgi:endo-1,4-beta-xylanase